MGNGLRLYVDKNKDLVDKVRRLKEAEELERINMLREMWMENQETRYRVKQPSWFAEEAGAPPVTPESIRQQEAQKATAERQKVYETRATPEELREFASLGYYLGKNWDEISTGEKAWMVPLAALETAGYASGIGGAVGKAAGIAGRAVRPGVAAARDISQLRKGIVPKGTSLVPKSEAIAPEAVTPKAALEAPKAPEPVKPPATAVEGAAPISPEGTIVPKVGISPAGEGVKPPNAPILNKVMGMWREPTPKGPSSPVVEKLISIEEKLTDKFAGINKLTARARKAAGGTLPVEDDAELHAALMAGVPERAVQESKDVYKAVKTSMGNVDQSYVDTYLHLRHSIDIESMKGPQRLIAGGVKGASEAQRGLDEMAQVLGAEQYAKVEQAATLVKDHYSQLLDAKVRSGLVSQELADTLKSQYPWYSPIKYLEYIADYSGTGGKQLSVTASGLKRLSEIGSEVARERPLNTLARATLQSEMLIARNDAARAIIKLAERDPLLQGKVRKVSGVRPVAQVEGEAIFRRPAGEQRGTISYMENGKRVLYEVPEWLEREAKYLPVLTQTPLERFGSFLNAIPRAGMTGMNIAFFVPNLAVDTLTAMLTQGVMPWTVGRRLALNLRAMVATDKTMQSMLKSKGGLSGFWGKTPEAISREVVKNGQLVLDPKWDAKRILKAPFEALSSIGHAVEMAPRTAVYEVALGRGLMPEQAALAARRATIDFARSGTAIRQANALYLYLNAGLQGSMVPFRALRDSARARYWLAGYLALVAGEYAWNRQFPEYDDVPDYVRYGGHIFMLPSEEYDTRGNKVPHYIRVVPNAREWSLFSGPIKYMLARLEQRNTGDVEQFVRAWAPGINPVSQVADIGGGAPVFGSVPTQLGQTLFEIGVNRDTFRDRPIVPTELQGKPVAEQYDKYTSETARRMGSLLNISPMKIDHFIKGFGGGVGQQVISGIDKVLDEIEPNVPDAGTLDLYNALRQIASPPLSPEDVKTQRNKFLYSLPVEQRQAVLDMEREPEKQIPVVTNIYRRIYGTYGGQLYKTGQEKAADVTGVSVEQTSAVSKALSDVGISIDDAQQRLDSNFIGKKITGEQWKDAHGSLGEQWAGAYLTLGVIYPSSAQVQSPEVWQAYLEAVSTLAGSMPDMRTKTDILYTAYKSIRVEEPIEGMPDFDTYFQRRDAFMEALSEEDRNLLQEQLEIKLTQVEKQYYADMEKIRPYFEVRDLFLEADPALKSIVTQIEEMLKLGTPDALAYARYLEGSLPYKSYSKQLDMVHRGMRERDPKLDEALRRWGYIKYPVYMTK